MNRKEVTTNFVLQIVHIVLTVALFATLVFHIAMPEPVIVARPATPVATEPPVAAEKTPRELQNGKPFIYIGMGLGHPVIALMMQGFLDACEKYNLLCVTIVKPLFEDSDMLINLDQALAWPGGSSGWVSSAYSPYRAKTEQAIAQGIPVTTFHTPLKPEDLPGSLAWVATNIEEYGKAAADAIAEKVACKGPIAITQNNFNDTENLAASSFTAEMLVKCPDIEVLAPEIEGGELSSSIAKAASILVAHPDLTAAFGTTGASPTTWGKALEQSGHKPGDVIVIGMDYTKPNLDLVKAGWVYALVGQPIYEETYRCVELLVAFLQGKPVSFDNYMPAPIITAADLEKYYGYQAKLDKAVNP